MSSANAQPVIRLSGHAVPLSKQASFVGRVEKDADINFAMTLPLRNEGELDTLLARLYDPKDALYGQYLTPREFTDRFGPTESDYERLKAYARSQGFTVTSETPGRTILNLAAPASVVESSFKVALSQYQAASGRTFIRPDSEPAVDASVAPLVRAVVGLDTSARMTPHVQVAPGFEQLSSNAAPQLGAGGSGPGSTFAPRDVAVAYGFPYSSTVARGQTIAVFELDGFLQSDINAYEAQFGLPNVPIETVLINNATAGVQTVGGQMECTVDLDLLIGLAQGATKIINYTTTNDTVGLLNGYQQIATENRASVVTSSWGNAEQNLGSTFASSENAIFKQMAAQGQSMFAAAGDNGSTDGTASLAVDDPAAQPYVTGCGGTHLSTNGAGGPWKSETVWNNLGTTSGGATGGGISANWRIPTWQSAAAAACKQASLTFRNVPDVALNSDTLSPYACYVSPNGKTGAWYGIAGTSTATPLWATFAAIVNQARATAGKAPIGFMNPVLYGIAAGSRYATDFHDIVSGNNPTYNAVVGYDPCTGLGSPNGANLLADLVAYSTAPTISSISPTNATANLGLTLTVNGSGFANTSSVHVGAIAVPTTFVNQYKLTAAVPSSALAAAGAVAVTVVTPPPGGGTSNSASLTVAALSPVIAHLLWKSTGGSASVWTVKLDWSHTSSAAYGPYGGWQARAIADGADGNSRLLWTDSGGAFAVWTLKSDGTYSSTASFGPIAGWTASTISVGSDGRTRILLKNTSGAAAVWTLNSNGTFGSSTAAFGPYGTWQATDLAVGGDNLIKLMWKSGGSSSVWKLNSLGVQSISSASYGPYGSWSASDIAVGGDGAARLLWNGAGAASVWTLDSNLNMASSTAAYGPFGAWTVRGFAVAYDNGTRLLWSDGAGAYSIWLQSGNGFVSSPAYGPYSGWSVAGVAAP